MKKTYINPQMEVVKMKISQHLLDGSMGVNSNPVDGSKALGREDDFDWDD